MLTPTMSRAAAIRRALVMLVPGVYTYGRYGVTRSQRKTWLVTLRADLVADCSTLMEASYVLAEQGADHDAP